jgi:hypothetical protein
MLARTCDPGARCHRPPCRVRLVPAERGPRRENALQCRVRYCVLSERGTFAALLNQPYYPHPRPRATSPSLHSPSPPPRHCAMASAPPPELTPPLPSSSSVTYHFVIGPGLCLMGWADRVTRYNANTTP